MPFQEGGECSTAVRGETANGLAGANVLVTGASGFIGSHLCGRLIREGAVVHGFSRKARRSPDAGVHWWQADLGSPANLLSLVREIKPDRIFHLAGYVTGSRELRHVLPSMRGNLVGTVNLLTAAADVGCRRLILTGSLEEPDDLDREAVPCSPYAVGKWAGQAYARMFHALYGLPVVTLRLFMVYGPGQQDLTKLIPSTIRAFLRGKAPRLSSGKRLVDWIYVEDVVDALIAAATVKGLEGCTVDVGTGRMTTVAEVVNRLVRLTNPKIVPLFGQLPDRAFERERVADIKQAQALLGWVASTELEAGLEKTVEWYRQTASS